MEPAPPAGAVLAGGRSERMGGQPKALLPLAGVPLLSHVLERFAPQVDELVLSVERPTPELNAFGVRQVPDPAPGSNGPLGGLLACMRALSQDGRGEWLLLAPCDAPFLPLDLGARLLARAGEAGSGGAVVRWGGVSQPTFSLWHRDLLPELERAVIEDNLGGFRQFLRRRPLAVLDWPSEAAAPPFFNINDRQALATAEGMLRSTTG
ncbi:MAG: molybdenum cofactor guanylyltransferase [Xanthomonadales bacterium]|nr:molybdenum cofactor guanylyltransferase [Xanthomonadales bacterium]